MEACATESDYVCGVELAAVPPLSTLELLKVLLILSVEREWGVPPPPPPWVDVGGEDPPPTPAGLFLKLSGRLMEVNVLWYHVLLMDEISLSAAFS